jgi:hypothetical protein
MSLVDDARRHPCLALHWVPALGVLCVVVSHIGSFAESFQDEQALSSIRCFLCVSFGFVGL